MKRDANAFTAVEKTGRKMQFAWMPNVNTIPKYPDPWRPGKLSVFDLSKKLKDVLGDMIVYHVRFLIAKHKAMTKMSEEQLQDYFLDLQALAYRKAMAGLKSWKPIYGLNLYIQNHVRFAAMSLKTEREAAKLQSPILVPNETVSDLNMSFGEAMALAEQYDLGDKESEAARIYEIIAQQTADNDGELPS